jgi:hypothetical protein
MRYVCVAAALALLSVPAQAQHMRGKRAAANPQQTEAQKKQAAETEKAYKAVLDKIPDSKAKPDPWRNVR